MNRSTSAVPPRPSPFTRVTAWSRRETTGGLLLVLAAAAALVWANSPWRDAYHQLGSVTVGPAALNLDLGLASWAADGVLAVFFFVVGLELKHELVAGALRNRREAAVPVLAAIGGVVVPSLLFLAVVGASGGDPSHLQGWAIPAATDIAFALAVLAIFGKGLPAALRVFLLTLAVVDDLIAITIIAVAYTSDLSPVWLIPAVALIALFAVLARRGRPPVWALVPIALITWVLVHEAGVHATVAGVVLGLVVPAGGVGEHDGHGRAHRWGHALTPWSSTVALPVFAFFAAGVTIVDDGFGVVTHPVALGVMAGLVVGKIAGILGVTAVVVRVTPFRLPPGIGVRDLVPIGLLCGIGFTVALLIAELSFDDEQVVAAGKTAVLLASLVCAAMAAVALRADARRARDQDMNRDGIDDGVVAPID